MAECPPMKVLQLSILLAALFLMRLLEICDHPHPSGSQQFAYKNTLVVKQWPIQQLVLLNPSIDISHAYS